MSDFSLVSDKSVNTSLLFYCFLQHKKLLSLFNFISSDTTQRQNLFDEWQKYFEQKQAVKVRKVKNSLTHMSNTHIFH